MADWMRMFDGRLEVKPPLDERQLAEVPAKRGVLCLLAAEDKPIVLLVAADLRARLRGRLTPPPPPHRGPGAAELHEQQETPGPGQRRRTPQLQEITRKICWKLAGGYFEADLRYFELARRIWPKTFPSLLAWRLASFVHVNIEDPFPHFARRRDVFAQGGLYVGPFGDGRSADRFIEAIQDAFDLCRDYQCLRKSPHGQRCAYAQMGRCLCPCDGSISMADYTAAVARAAEFAAGRREWLRRELTDRMKALAGRLEYELAANIKARIDRLGEFEGPPYAHVAPAEQFQFLLVQPGSGSRQAKVFFVDRGSVDELRPLDYPLNRRQLRSMLRQAAARAARPRAIGEADRWRIALVGRYLFCSDRRKGLMIRWRADLTVEAIAAAVEGAAKSLRLRAPRPPKKPNLDKCSPPRPGKKL